MQNEALIAQKLLQIKAIKLSPQTPFTWASGIKSPIYCDNRITLSYPEVRNLVKKGFAEMAKKYPEVDCIAGVATAGIAHGALLADALDLPYIYVRAKAKEHGRQNLIEGEMKEGANILVVEDLISTGGSSIQAVEALREAGGNVILVAAIFTYGFQQAEDNFAAVNCSHETLCNYPILLKEALAINYISEEQHKELVAWNKDPKGWYENKQ